MECSTDNPLSQEIVVLNIPAGAVLTGNFNADTGCSFFKKLGEVNVSTDHTTLSSKNGILYDKAQTKLISCPRALSGKVVIPDTVIKIDSEAFYGCSLIKEVVIPDRVTEIKERTFADCKALKKVVLPNNMEKMGKEAFFKMPEAYFSRFKGNRW